MKIVYVGRFGQNNTDDEGSITFALRELGHDVIPVEERKAQYKIDRYEVDFLLFNHWYDFETMKKFSLPKVCWCFDLISSPRDRSLRSRNCRRISWSLDVGNLADLCFFTDGDWVKARQNGKLVHLMQGANQRIVGYGQKWEGVPPILFAGCEKGGHIRRSFVREMETTWGSKFQQVKKLYGPRLADEIASAKVVVAPDYPITNNYWSNRVYITCGFGGVMLHPYSEGVAQHFVDREEILFYYDRKDLHEKIQQLLDDLDLRRKLREGALQRVLKEHTYTHRCEVLVKVVQERLI